MNAGLTVACLSASSGSVGITAVVVIEIAGSPQGEITTGTAQGHLAHGPRQSKRLLDLPADLASGITQGVDLDIGIAASYPCNNSSKIVPVAAVSRIGSRHSSLG